MSIPNLQFTKQSHAIICHKSTHFRTFALCPIFAMIHSTDSTHYCVMVRPFCCLQQEKLIRLMTVKQKQKISSSPCMSNRHNCNYDDILTVTKCRKTVCVCMYNTGQSVAKVQL